MTTKNIATHPLTLSNHGLIEPTFESTRLSHKALILLYCSSMETMQFQWNVIRRHFKGMNEVILRDLDVDSEECEKITSILNSKSASKPPHQTPIPIFKWMENIDGQQECIKTWSGFHFRNRPTDLRKV